MRAATITRSYEEAAAKGQNKAPVNVVFPLLRAFGSKFLFAVLLKLAQDVLKFVSPQILKQLVKFVQVNTG